MKATAERVRELLNYDPETGVFTWREGANLGKGHGRRKPGGEAGCKGARYTILSIDGQHVYAHRVAWLYMTGEWPPATVDHRNRDTYCNRWANLRLATIAEQRQNSALSRRNTSGRKGVSWDASKGKWAAQIGAHGKRHHIGRFDDVEQAAAAYADAKAKRHQFHPAV
jgi:hypothetical protein